MKWRLYCSILFLLLSLSCSRWQPATKHAQLTEVKLTNLVADTLIVSLLLPYKSRVDSSMNIVLVENAITMKKEQPETALGNMMADIMFQYALDAGLNPDLAITNYGGIRVPVLEKGPLTYRDAFQLMPFDNKIVVMAIPGDILFQWFQHMAAKGGWPVAQARYQISGERKLSAPVYIGGSALDTAAVYTVVTTDYLATGGDYCDFLKTLTYSDTGFLLRDAIINYWKATGERGEKLSIEKDGRVSYVE
jgi:2',3'-cyclic-nucleotide 2'-phosphodiesterase (5'-nucleotidase family)